MTAIVPGSVEAVVFGTDDAGVIVERIAELVRAAIGAELADVRWYVASVSCVAGVLVDDGREVVVRAYQPSVTARFVRSVIRAQTHVTAAGFPAPEPLSGPVQLPWGLGRAEALVSDPGMRYPPASAMAVSAAALAQLVTLLEDVDAEGLDEHPMLHFDGLYPTPHSPLFDFAATAAGAEWIDEIATAARAVLDAEDAPIVIGHTDWSSRKRPHGHRSRHGGLRLGEPVGDDRGASARRRGGDVAGARAARRSHRAGRRRARGVHRRVCRRAAAQQRATADRAGEGGAWHGVHRAMRALAPSGDADGAGLGAPR